VTWDETRVLDGSRIGELAAFARRSGSVWYVAMVNGTADLKMVSFSPVFTGWRQARLSQLSDVTGQAQSVKFATRLISGTAPLIVTLEPCGGFVAKLERE
jgi:alpha-glucosidase